MIRQKELIRNGDWDCLIILDACRYDYFERLYREYLAGKLHKVISQGSHTTEWFKRNFGKEYYNNIVYISGNPFINSRLDGFRAGDHFYRVIDVWDSGWDSELNTVKPQTISRATRRARARYPEKQLISHFIQPHFPYLSLASICAGIRDWSKKRDEYLSPQSWEREEETLSYLAQKKAVQLLDLLGPRVLRGLRVRSIIDSFKTPKISVVQQVAEKVDIARLRSAYEANLRIVLEEVRKIVEVLPGKVVVTSDHGERLGEGGKYDHTTWSADPLLIEVPWLEVEK